jgi:enoyl-CoA hydratase/carnithine racemase
MPSPILCDRDATVTTITLNRPDVGNRVTNDMLDTLRQMIDESAASRVIVLRGTGPDFCHGRELPKEAHGKLTAIEARKIQTAPMLDLAAAFERSSVPVIGVVRGKVFGGACALAALCDVTIAGEDATFMLPELNHGIPPCLAMGALAPRVPRKAIVHMVYTAEPIDAKKALAIGLVSEVVPLAELEARAAAVIKKLVGFAPPAVQAVKQYMRSAAALDGQASADLAANLLANVVSSQG